MLGKSISSLPYIFLCVSFAGCLKGNRHLFHDKLKISFLPLNSLLKIKPKWQKPWSINNQDRFLRLSVRFLIPFRLNGSRRQVERFITNKRFDGKGVKIMAEQSAKETLNKACACGSGKRYGECCGKNEPCSCGSGKKAGECCFRKK